MILGETEVNHNVSFDEKFGQEKLLFRNVIFECGTLERKLAALNFKRQAEVKSEKKNEK